MPQIKSVSYIENARTIVTGLQSARLLYGYDQDEAAQMVGRSQSWLSEVEKGYTRLTLAKACEMADLYGLELRLCDRRQG